MKRSTYVVLTAAMMCCLFSGQAAQAQNSLIYATADYDDETNTVYGYAYTEPDYSAGIYYNRTFVGASINDDDGNLIDTDNKMVYGRAEIFLEGSGTGNPPYKISSGHYAFMTYFVYNYWDPYYYQYRNGYLDYYNYTYFSEGPGGPVINIPLYFQITGRNPHTVTPSINRFLGSLLSYFLEPSAPNSVKYNTVRVDSISRGFNSFTNIAEFPLNETSGWADYCYGGASNEFTAVLDFNLPAGTSEVFQDNRSYVSETNQSQFQRSSSLLFSNINLSGEPKSGRVSITLFRKRPSASFPDNKVRVTIAGRISGGQGFSATGRVRFTCP